MLAPSATSWETELRLRSLRKDLQRQLEHDPPLVEAMSKVSPFSVLFLCFSCVDLPSNDWTAVINRSIP